MNGLSRKHVVLGLLIERQGYAYEIWKRLGERGLDFLGLTDSAVYKILDRLETEGLIEVSGEKRTGRTRRGAPRVIYRATNFGRADFKAWIATPSSPAILRDDLRAKLNVGEPDDLPVLLALAESQHRECLAKLATLQRPILARAAEPDVQWHHAAVMMNDDLQLRFLQALVDWLDGICAVMEERIERMAVGLSQKST